MGIEGHQRSQLRGDASVTVKQTTKQSGKSAEEAGQEKTPDKNMASSTDSKKILPSVEKDNYVPPHLRKQAVQTSTVNGKYVPPHLRNRQA